MLSLVPLLASSALAFNVVAPPSIASSARSSVAAVAAARPVLAARACRMQDAADDVPPPEVVTPAGWIEFIVGVPEPCVPDVSLTRSKDGSTGVATFTFDNPSFLAAASQELGETTGMYLKDSEGTLKSSDVTATFVNGRPRIVKGVHVMRGADEWDRFMRFMERYAEANGLGFSKA